MKIKTLLKVVGILVACYVVYVLTAMLIPFAHQKSVSETRRTFNRDNYYSSSVSVDQVSIVEDSNDALEERIRMIQGAKKQIVFSTFDMRQGHSTEDVISALIHAAERGVKIKVMVDGMMGMVHMKGDLFYAMSAQPNIQVKVYNTPNLLMPWTINGRLHDKYLIADHTVMVLGGRNTYDYFLGDYIDEHESYDRDLLVFNSAYEKKTNTDSVIFQVENYFDSIWNSPYSQLWQDDEALLQDEDIANQVTSLRAHYDTLKKANPNWFVGYGSYDKRTEKANKVTLISGETGIYSKEPLVWYQLMKLMADARESVQIHTPYAVMGGDMYDGIRRVAQTVPETSMMINAVETGDNFVASSDYIFNKRKLTETGVKLLEFVGDKSYHGKSIVVDHRLAIVGSYNMDLRSTYMDTELMLAVDCPSIAKQLEDNMRVFENQAKQVIISEEDEVAYANDDLIIDEMPWYKKVAMRITGFFLQPIRYVV